MPPSEHAATLELEHPSPVLCSITSPARRRTGRLRRDGSVFRSCSPTRSMQLIRNVNAARAGSKRWGQRGEKLQLVANHDFKLLERTVQPTLRTSARKLR